MMIARRVALVAAAALGLAACTEVTQTDMPAELVFASFASPNIPTPNDLALRSIAAPDVPASAQKEFLQAFVNAGGFPSDQEVTINIPFRSQTWNGSAYEAGTPPTIDPATVTDQTFVLLQLDGTTATEVAWEVGDADPVTAGTQTAPGVLTIRNPASAATGRRWTPGARYVFALRGGASGVKTTDGKAVAADSAVELAIPNRDLTKKENQPLGAIPDSNENGTNADEIALLENVRRALWTPVRWGTTGGVWGPTATPALAPFQAVQQHAPWALTETASIAAFNVAPAAAGPLVLVDSGSGVVPLPIDLLRTDADGTVITNPAFGAAAAGLTTLDGFSTTAMMLAQTSGPIDASTVHGGNVLLYTVDTVNGTATLVPEFKALLQGGGNVATAGYIAQPPQLITPQGTACPIAGGCSVAIGLQPAAGVSAQLTLPPLRSNTMYAVVITSRVTGLAGATAPMAKPTVGKILLDLTAEPATGTPGDTTGVSTLSGVSNETARGLRDMRAHLAPVWDALPENTTKADVAFAYTFKTQTVQDTSLRLAAAPYGIEAGAGAAIFTPSAVDATTPPAAIPNVAGWFTVTFNSLDGIDKTTGAFRPTLANDIATNPAALLAPLKALVAVPDPANVPNNCPAPADALKCAPLVIVGHGLNGSKETLYALASTLAANGFVAAAIDFPLHGGRNWCRSNADCTTDGTADGTCTPFTGGAGQGDAQPPGVCTDGSVSRAGDSRYFVSANFFRMRDAFRQNVLDQSALGLALARPPAPLAPQPPGNPFVTAAAALGVAVNPTQIFYEGLSLGSIAGTQVVATNPRITRASLAVGGATFADIAINSPAFRTQLEPLFASLIPGFSWAAVTPGDPAFNPTVAAGFLRTVNVAKWILDPGEAANYALHVSRSPLPNLLTPATDDFMAPKAALGLISNLDTVVPNGQNLMLYNLMGASQVFYSSNLDGGVVPHGMMAATSANLAGAAGEVVRGDAAGWLLGTTPPTARTLTLQ